MEHANNKDLLSALTGQAAAAELVRRYGRLSNLAQASFEDLQAVKGVGRSRASAIKAAFLIAQRLSKESYPEAPMLDTPERVADLLREQNRAYTVEHLQVVFLNTRRRLIGVENISQGTLDSVLAMPREVFASAISRRASAIILAHNHPSGDASPSEADIRVTRELIRAGQILKIEVLDHIILGRRTDQQPRDFCSLRELGYFGTV